MPTLRPIQQQAVDLMLTQLHRTTQQGHSGATAVAAAGCGKTIMALAVAHALRSQAVVVLVSQTMIMEQWQERIRACFGDAVPVYLLDKKAQSSTAATQQANSRFCVVMLQTLLRRDVVLKADLLIVDEAHHMPACQFRTALDKIEFKRSLALTATPERRDGLETLMYYMLGPNCLEQWARNPAVKQALLRRTSLLPQVTMLTFRHTDDRRPWYRGKAPSRYDYTRAIDRLTRVPARNSGLVDVLLRMLQLSQRGEHPRKGLVLSNRKHHLERLCKQLRHRGEALGLHQDQVGILVGGRKRKNERTTFYDFVTFSTYAYVGEAVDFDGDFVVLATPASRVTQAIGRILRGHSPNKPLIIDVDDRLALPHFPAMTKRRESSYAEYTVARVAMSDMKLA